MTDLERLEQALNLITQCDNSDGSGLGKAARIIQSRINGLEKRGST